MSSGTARPMSDDTTRALIRAMRLIRTTEETIAARYGEQEMRCPTHLSSGQEAVAAAVGLHLKPTDQAVSGHRAHAHYLAKGGNLEAMIAEIYGKETGCSRGKGGSMHLIDESAGFMGSTAIVGGTVPVGVGLAYALKMKGGNDIACIFHGDAVAETGVFYESVNFAVLKNLPVLFVCENNFYSVYSPLDVRQPKGRRIHEMVKGLGLPSLHSDGNDARDVHDKTGQAVEHIRAGKGPYLIEFDTYRWREHCGPNYDDDLGYRPEDQVQYWKEREPIALFEKDCGIVADEISAIQAEIDAVVAAAFEAAHSAPFPPEEQAYTDLYTPQGMQDATIRRKAGGA